jgi:DNA-binding response OmpR family regulator
LIARPEAPILVVEDDEATCTLLRLALAEEGFDTDVAGSGPAAFALMRARRPRLILLDLHMPGMDGAAFLEELHRHEEWQSVPVLVVSAQPGTGESVGGEPVQGVLAKPFDLNDLVRRVRDLLPAG